MSGDNPLGDGWSDLLRVSETPTPIPMAVQIKAIARRLRTTTTAVKHTELDSDFLAPALSSWMTSYKPLVAT